MSLQVVRSHTLIVTLITFELLEVAVMFLLLMLLKTLFGLGPIFTLITVNIALIVMNLDMTIQISPNQCYIITRLTLPLHFLPVIILDMTFEVQAPSQSLFAVLALSLVVIDGSVVLNGFKKLLTNVTKILLVSMSMKQMLLQRCFRNKAFLTLGTLDRSNVEMHLFCVMINPP